MEEIVALIIQLVLEIGLQLLGAIGVDWVASTTTRKTKDGEVREEDDGCGWLVIFAFLGAVCGGISLLIRPELILPNLGLRIANLILAPLIAGGLSYLVSAYVWTTRGQNPGHHFWRGFWFALLFGVIRFAYAHR